MLIGSVFALGNFGYYDDVDVDVDDDKGRTREMMEHDAVNSISRNSIYKLYNK